MFRFAVLAVLVACAYGAALPKGLVPMPDGRIVGGENTNIESYPYQLSMVHFGSHRCGASIISQRVAITAAHCTAGVTMSALQMRAGSSQRTSGGVLVNVASLVDHPQYNDNTLDFDLSVMFLADSLQFGSGIAAIQLASSGSSVGAGSMITVTGWGALSEGGSSPNQLQRVSIPVVTNADCARMYADFNPITTNMMCAGRPEGGIDSCQGDSGGPAAIGNTLVGVVSWGFGCARPNYPGVYTNVGTLRGWVDSVIN